jgi:hypothetical protein
MKNINKEPVIIDLSHVEHIDTLFIANLKNLLLKNYKLYLLLNEKDEIFYKINKKHLRILNIDTLKFFNIDPKIIFNNIDTIYSIIRKDDNVYSIFFPRYGEPVSIPDAEIEKEMKDWKKK